MIVFVRSEHHEQVILNGKIVGCVDRAREQFYTDPRLVGDYRTFSAEDLRAVADKIEKVQEEKRSAIFLAFLDR